MEKSPLIDSLHEALEKYKDNIAMEALTDSAWDSISYAELKERIDCFSSFVASEGLKEGNKAVFILENSPSWGILFFSCLSIGVIVVPVDIQFRADDIKNIIDDCSAEYIFLSEKLTSLEAELKGCSSIKKIFRIDEELSRRAGLNLPYGRNFTNTGQLRSEPPAVPQAEGLALILYTSGTTSSPKGVMLTHKNIYSNFSSVYRLNILTAKDSVLSVLPLHHSYSLMVTLIAPILGGGRVVYPGNDWPDRLADYVRMRKITILVGVPQMFHALHRRIENKIKGLKLLPKLFVYMACNVSWALRKKFGINLAKIFLVRFHKVLGRQMRFFISGGAKIDERVEEDFFKLGFTILEGYGLTETSPAASFNTPDKPKIGSVGRPVPDVDIKIVGKDPEGIGEVAIKGPNVMKGYYNKEEETEACLKKGWFYTGDLGYFDDEGYLYLTGRSKELIVLSSGKNIYPHEIEALYSGIPFVKEICVLGVSRKDKGKTQDYLHAVVLPDFDYLKERGEMNVYDVLKNRFEDVSRCLPSYKHIMGFVVINEPLARTALGKIKRYEVEKRYIDDILSRRPDTKREILLPEEERVLGKDTARKVIGYLRENFDIKTDIRLNSSIEIDLGIDSLGRAELLSAMERAFGVKLPERMVAASIFTVNDLIASIERGETTEGKGTGLETVSISELIKSPLSEEFLKKIKLDIDIFDYMLTSLVKGLIFLIFKIFYRLEVEGKENIPKDGPYVICPNHVSFLDGFIVEAALPFHSAIQMFFMGFRRYFIVPVVRSLVRRGRILPIDASQIIDAMQAAYFILKNNKALCIFPEGERSFDGEPQRFKKGVGVIAKEVDVKFVPALIEGAFEAWPRSRRFPRLSKIKIIFGKPIDSKELLEHNAEEVASLIREKVIELKASGQKAVQSAEAWTR
ncbi:MAG: AMP-binding protein [Candidatus Omnitrophota bacterium]